MIISSKLSDEELQKRIYASAGEYSKLIGKSFLIIGKNLKSPYFGFECKFEQKHFMHLLGIKSKTLSADAFFDACFSGYNGTGNGISIKDCTPSRNHNRTTINEKCSCSQELFRLQDAKYMKIGLKDKVRQYVDFTYAYGSVAVLGFQVASGHSISFPITLIPRSIDDFSSQKYKIMFILEKEIGNPYYRNLYVEIKKGLFKTCMDELPSEIKEKILLEEEENA